MCGRTLLHEKGIGEHSAVNIVIFLKKLALNGYFKDIFLSLTVLVLARLLFGMFSCLKH